MNLYLNFTFNKRWWISLSKEDRIINHIYSLKRKEKKKRRKCPVFNYYFRRRFPKYCNKSWHNNNRCLWRREEHRFACNTEGRSMFVISGNRERVWGSSIDLSGADSPLWMQFKAQQTNTAWAERNEFRWLRPTEFNILRAIFSRSFPDI